MLVYTGRENSDGEFTNCRVVGDSRDGETAKDAITRIAERFLSVSLADKKHRWVDEWERLGPHETPTARLPALFVGRQLFSIKTQWDSTTDEHSIAE